MAECLGCGKDHEAESMASEEGIAAMLGRIFGAAQEDVHQRAERQQAEVTDQVVQVIEQAMKDAAGVGGDGAAGVYQRAVWVSGYLGVTLQPSSISLGAVALGLEVLKLRTRVAALEEEARDLAGANSDLARRLAEAEENRHKFGYGDNPIH